VRAAKNGASVAVDLKSHLVNHVVNVIASRRRIRPIRRSGGVICHGKTQHRKLKAGAPPVDLATDKSWVWSDKAGQRWQIRSSRRNRLTGGG